MARVIGVDFDNTLVSYDELVYETALERGLIDASVEKDKKSVRDSIRQIADRDGEVEWQRLQALVYGPAMARARPVDGALDVLAEMHRVGVPVFVVSHKTEYANYDRTRTSLRGAALDWMTRQGFFDPERLGLDRSSVYFEDTRQLKIDRIRRLGCTHFIDDLEEVFLEESFPPDVERILFTTTAPDPPHGGMTVLGSWEAIGARLLGS